MPPKRKMSAALAPPRSKRATTTRGTAAQPGATAEPALSHVGAVARASGSARRRYRAAAVAPREEAPPSRSRSRSRSPVGGGTEEPRPPPPPPPPEAAAAAETTTPAAPRKRDNLSRTTDASLPRMEAAARAAAAAAAAAAVATERTVAVASPALRPWFRSGPFRVSEFARAGREALEEIDNVLRGSRSAAPPPPLAAAALLSAAAAAAAPPPLPPPAAAAAAAPATPGRSPRPQQPELPPLIPAGRAVALGPGGGRPLAPGRDVLVTLSLSEAGRPERPLRELVLLVAPPWRGGAEAGCGGGARPATLQDARDAFRGACPADAAADELGVGVSGAYCAVEGVVYTDGRGSSGVDYAAPILEFLAATGSLAPRPPREGEGSEAGADSSAAAAAGGAGRGRRRGARAAGAPPPSSPPSAPSAPLPGPPPPPWRAGDLSAASLYDLTLRLGGGGGYVFCHQGGCEHALAVRDVRLAAADDAAPGAGARGLEGPRGRGAEEEEEEERHPPTSGDFPLVLFKARPAKARSCQSCGSRRAARATWRDAAGPSDPAFWCARCYSDAHYDDSGRLLVPEHRVVEYRGG